MKSISSTVLGLVCFAVFFGQPATGQVAIGDDQRVLVWDPRRSTNMP